MDNKEKTKFFQPLMQWGPASLVSLTIHVVALYLILMLPPLKAPVKRVVQVDAITMTAVTPKPEGGQAGGSGAAPAPEPPQMVPKPPPPKPPEPKPKPKPMVRPPLRPAPEPDPIPPRLAMPRPAPPVVPPRPAPPSSVTSSSSRLSSSGSGIGRGSGSGSGTGIGTGSSSGVGSGRGYGSGTGSGAGSGSALQGYLAKVRSLLERHKIYPPQARSRNEQGTVVVRFSISSDGSIGGVSLSRSSGSTALDQAAQETVSRVGRFPPIPGDVQKSSLTVQVPLAYRLNGV